MVGIIALALAATSCGGVVEPTDSTSAGTASSTDAPVTSSTAPQPATSTTSEPDRALPAPAPWLQDDIDLNLTPTVLAEQWNAAGNRTWCSALYPANVADLAAQANVRSANFEGGWGIAWDLPDGPGRLAGGDSCDDCGRGAFGVAGAGLEATGLEADRWANIVDFEDGSRFGYGYEGDAAEDSGAPLLGYLLIRDEGCLYNVWSFLGENHLLTLVQGLQRVQGLRGTPTRWTAEQEVAATIDLGDPAWLEDPIARAEVPDLVFLEWESEAGAPDGCPLLYPTDLGEADAATIRRASNEGEMLVAWDLTDGPGHNGDGTPCDDCGRGVIGLGTFQFGRFEGPVAYRWSDGSEVRLRTGPFSYGTEAFARVAGFACDYWVWSHLGEEHLVTLLSSMRRVEGAP
jgi:hypothetical protein